MDSVVNLFVIAAVGVIIADLVAHGSGTATLFEGVANMWSTAVNGMMGNPVATPSISGGAATPAPAKGG
jgi:hypothetical protein